jgi:hypothetical protein
MGQLLAGILIDPSVLAALSPSAYPHALPRYSSHKETVTHQVA